MADQPLEYLTEPSLSFGTGQHLESPKDGLFMFGPLARDLVPGDVRYGVVGTEAGLKLFKEWIKTVRSFVPGLASESAQHRPFPGFAEVFGVGLPESPLAALVVKDEEIDTALMIADRHLAVYRTVEVYASRIARYMAEEEQTVAVWFVVVPERIYTFGRPQSVIPLQLRRKSDVLVDSKMAKSIAKTPSLFEEDNVAAEPYLYEVNFHNQLKARLLEGPNRAVVQVVRETAIAPETFLTSDGRPIRRVQDAATIAWNLCTTTYFKAVGRPWKLARIRENVCYVGLVFKKLVSAAEEGQACCGAQMFLDSGDGLVFKGAVGPWRSAETHEYHLNRESAAELMELVVRGYKDWHGRPPAELFIHAPNSFNDEEWAGFASVVPSETRLVGVRMRESNGLKLYRAGQNPVLRGTAFLQSSRAAFLWTRGYVPYLKTYPGREAPNPLRIDVLRGDAQLKTVLEDVLNLTKLNFNACIYGDGLPVTLRFADAVGEILTAGPVQKNQPPLPFKHYI